MLVLADIEHILVEWLRHWPFLAPTLFLLIRIIVTIVPFLPGIAVNTAGIFLFGWLITSIYVSVGTILGGVIIFAVMRKFREPLARRFVSIKKLDKYSALLSGRKGEFWVLFFLRIPAAIVFDYFSYAAGVAKVSFWRFFIVTTIVETAITFPMIYFSDKALHSGIAGFVLIAGSLLAVYFIIRRVDWEKLATRQHATNDRAEK